MKRWLWLPLLLLAFPCWAKTATTIRDLGDINRDGRKEVAIEEVKASASTTDTHVRIESAGKVLLRLPVLMGDTADGYKVAGQQIVAWWGDWVSVASKWQPHFYNIAKYNWGQGQQKYVMTREGMTRRPYGYKAAKAEVPQLAESNSAAVIWSKGSSFGADALAIASKKYGQRFTKAVELRNAGMESQMLARTYIIDEKHRGIWVIFKRDGTYEISSKEEEMKSW